MYLIFTNATLLLNCKTTRAVKLYFDFLLTTCNDIERDRLLCQWLWHSWQSKYFLQNVHCKQFLLEQRLEVAIGDLGWRNWPRYIGTWLLPQSIHLRLLGKDHWQSNLWPGYFLLLSRHLLLRSGGVGPHGAGGPGKLVSCFLKNQVIYWWYKHLAYVYTYTFQI